MTLCRRAVSVIVVGLTLACLDVSAARAEPSPAAKAHLDAGLERFNHRDFDQAIDEFKIGYAIDPQPDFLYVWAQAERMRGNCPGAMKLYKQYLGAALTQEQRDAATRNLERCQKALGGQVLPEDGRPEANPNPGVVPPVGDQGPRGSPWYTDVAGDVLVGVGIAGLGFGVVMYLGSTSDEDTAAAATRYDDYKSAIESAESKRTLAIVGLGAGTALIAGGVIRYLTRGHPHQAEVTGYVHGSGAGVLVFGRF